MKFDFSPFIPKSYICFKEGISREQFYRDLLAGITVGIIALPLAMAFAIGSGVAPERGLFTAIIAGFLISLLGGSRVQIGGPTGAYMVILFEVVSKHGYEGLATATLIAGIILLILGLTKCGAYIRFVPYPVITGFTTGIAMNIFISQTKDFFGLQVPKPSAEFVERITQYWQYKATFHPAALGIALLALIIVIGSRRYSRKIPGAIIAVIATSACVHFFNLDVFTITKKFGPIPSMLPTPSFPSITLDSLQAVFPDAITIALLGAIESLLSAVVADGMTGFRHLSNAELVGQGIGNLGSVIFGGFPATGAIARTTANIQLGARTPLSGMIHAVTMFVLMILFAPYAGMIPLPALAAILCFVAYNMAEFDHFFELLKGPKSDRLILLTTFCLTVFIDLTVAVQAGVLMAAFSFLKHMSEKTTCKVVELVKEEAQTDEKQSSSKPVPQAVVKGVQIFEIEGPFFFAVTDILSDALKVADKKPHTFILRMRDVPLIDISGMQALKKFYEKCAKHGIRLYITEIRLSVMRILIQSGVTHDIPETVFLPSLDKALEVAKR